MDIFPLLEEIQMLARNGLHYAQNFYDRERYERLLTLVSQYYGQTLDLPPETVKAQFSAELGHITLRLGAAIIRETYEECGLEVRPLQLIVI